MGKKVGFEVVVWCTGRHKSINRTTVQLQLGVSMWFFITILMLTFLILYLLWNHNTSAVVLTVFIFVPEQQRNYIVRTVFIVHMAQQDNKATATVLTVFIMCLVQQQCSTRFLFTVFILRALDGTKQYNCTCVSCFSDCV